MTSRPTNRQQALSEAEVAHKAVTEVFQQDDLLQALLEIDPTLQSDIEEIVKEELEAAAKELGG